MNSFLKKYIYIFEYIFRDLINQTGPYEKVFLLRNMNNRKPYALISKHVQYSTNFWHTA